MSFDRKNAVVATVIGALSLALAFYAYIKPPPAPPSPSVEAPVKQAATPVEPALVVAKPSTESAPPNPEDSLKWINTGITRVSLQERFGVPRFESANQATHTSNLVFVFPRFFLQAIVGADGTVLLYSVTTRSADFQPAIPKLGGNLLASPYSNFGASTFSAYMSSKFYEYREKIESSNATNFKTIYLGYCAAGFRVSTQGSVLEEEVKADPKALTRFRQQNSPNCYGVADMSVLDEKVLEQNGFGLDYFAGRELAD